MLRSSFLLLLAFTIAGAFNMAPTKKNPHSFHGSVKNRFMDVLTKPNAPKACSSAQVSQMQMCYTNMFRNFNISTPPYPSYDDFAMMRGNYLLYNGAPAMVRVCNWQHDLENCMQGLQDDCVNPDTYMSALNQNSTDYARDWFTESFTLRYACGPGFRELMQNFYCLESVGQYHQDDFYSCINQLVNQSSIPCNDYNSFIRCYMNIYLPECGRQSQHYVCMVERVAVAVNVPECESQLMQCDEGFMSSTWAPLTPGFGRKLNLRHLLNPVRRRQRKLPNH